MSVESIAELAEETAATLESALTDITAAQRFQDPDLQPHALATKREEKTAHARAKASEALAAIRTRAESTAAAASEKLESTRPRLAEDPAALIKAEQRWNYDVRPLLEAGASIKTILKEATSEDLLAIERFAPGYLKATKLKGTSNPMELEPEELSAAVNNRLTAILPEEQRSAFEEGVRTADAAEKLRKIHGMAADTIAGRTEYEASAGAHARSLAARLRG